MRVLDTFHSVVDLEEAQHIATSNTFYIELFFKPGATEKSFGYLCGLEFRRPIKLQRLQ